MSFHQEKVVVTKKEKASRRYTSATVKILFAFSGNQCAHPECAEPIVASQTDFSNAAVIGQIAHIYAHSDGGPRSKPGLTEKERNSHENLLLLCPNHHRIIDSQHETYPAELLLRWKSDHAKKAQSVIRASISDIGYAELEVAARALMDRGEVVPDDNTNILSIKDKIERNNLGSETEFLLKIGTPKTAEVGEILEKSTQLYPKFPDRLKGGFVLQYNKLRSQGIMGDDLFAEMWTWASGYSNERSRELAGLCILTHLFIICEVFET